MPFHTPGPWHVDDEGHVAHRGNMTLLSGRICHLIDPTHPSSCADARLIAAAPDLYDIVANLSRLKTGPTDHTRADWIGKILALAERGRAVIAKTKATGQ